MWVVDRKLSPLVKERNPLLTKDSAHESRLRITEPCTSPAHTDRDLAQRRKRSCSVGSPCDRQVHASGTQAETTVRSAPSVDACWSHLAGTLSVSPAVPRRGSKASPAGLLQPTQRFGLRWLAFLLAPQEVGLELCACWKWHGGRRGCWVSREHGPARPPQPRCSAAGCLPMHDSPRSPARNVNVEDSGREGASERAAAHFRAAEESM